MAKVQWNGTETVTVAELGGLTVKPGDIVEVPDDRYEGYVPPPENRSPDHPWAGVEKPSGSRTAKKTTAKAKD